MKQYILTGGPSSGKTTLIGMLSDDFQTVPEAAELVIQEQQTKGIEIPQIQPNFQGLVYQKQKQQLEDLPYAPIAIFDRSIADGLAYCALFDKPVPDGLASEDLTNRFEEVFLIENLGFAQDNGIRYEDNDLSIKIQEQLFKTYRELGYNPIRVPAFCDLSKDDSIAQRMKIIYEQIKC